MSFRHTGKEEYLNTAKKIAHYFIANIPEDGLIPVDFRQPANPLWYDDTAAAIAACGLLEIAAQVGELEQEMYLNAAYKLLKALYDNHCDFTEHNDCVLTKCSSSYHAEDHEFAIIYGDYFFLEALLKIRGNDFYLW